jgi:hypothetical protein
MGGFLNRPRTPSPDVLVARGFWGDNYGYDRQGGWFSQYGNQYGNTRQPGGQYYDPRRNSQYQRQRGWGGWR